MDYWNDVLLEVVRRNLAMYDAESSYQLQLEGQDHFRAHLQAETCAGWLEGPDEEERVIGRTADHILRGIDPGQTHYLDARFRVRFGSESTGFDVLDATVVNKMVAPVRTARTSDGSDKDLAVVGDKGRGRAATSAAPGTARPWRPYGGRSSRSYWPRPRSCGLRRPTCTARTKSCWPATTTSGRSGRRVRPAPTSPRAVHR
ncbi:hypothetical protein GCM10010215_26260 [Streptomyces virginiae]|uniref:Uncharacterized protein n=1 Tax=Streptomyces virginiae TaxID=1961 RepID=A0ABQ3NN45_STRVG|nr:hypothetical protein GCM10010215_26260 [Streptomyces virginiae]GHI14195.1 hypothetical protein Scinn_36580 [Streptomyces virginiae]